jgi:type I restriction enzyme, S subunit
MSAAWPNTALGEVLAPAIREYHVDPSAKYPLLGVRLDGQGPFHRETVLGTQTSATRLYRVKAGDFIYSRLFAWRGAFGLIKENLDDHFVSSEFPTFTPIGNRVDPKYLNYWFRLPDVLRQVEADCSGSTPLTRNRYKEQFFYALQIPLPPLDEQRHIVARIEKLAVKVEKARRLRETASEEASALVPAHLGAVFGNLADHYSVHPLGELSSHIVDGPHQTPSYLADKSGVPFVTVKNMVTGKLSFDDLNYVSAEDHREFTKRCRAERGDVLYSKDGATKGRPCYVDTDNEFSFFVSVALIKPLRDRLDSRYLVHLLNSSWIKDRMIDKSRGDMIPHIVLREIRAFPVPLPSLDKQREIVATLDTLHIKVDAMKTLQAKTAAELNAMLPAILDKAFKGAL